MNFEKGLKIYESNRYKYIWGMSEYGTYYIYYNYLKTWPHVINFRKKKKSRQFKIEDFLALKFQGLM